jgi:hypothetical protein
MPRLIFPQSRGSCRRSRDQLFVLVAKISQSGQLRHLGRHATRSITSSTLDATTAHCLPPSSAVAPDSHAPACLDFRRPPLKRSPSISPQYMPAPKAPWQPCPGAIGGKKEGSKASHDSLGQFLSPGQLSIVLQPGGFVQFSLE